MICGHQLVQYREPTSLLPAGGEIADNCQAEKFMRGSENLQKISKTWSSIAVLFPRS